MPARRPAFAVAALLAGLCACATSAPRSDLPNDPGLDAVVDAKVREGRGRGYPNLSDVPTPTQTPADAAALADGARTLTSEASALRSLRDLASQPRSHADLDRKKAKLLAEIRAARAELADQPPIRRPSPESPLPQ